MQSKIASKIRKPIFGREARIDAEDLTKERAELAAPIRLARSRV